MVKIALQLSFDLCRHGTLKAKTVVYAHCNIMEFSVLICSMIQLTFTSVRNTSLYWDSG